MTHASFRPALRSIIVASLSLGTAAALSAADVGSIAVHGSLSATASYSGEYNYQGTTKDHLDLNVIELTLNGAHQFENGIRASAQLYAYDLDDYKDVVLDFATLNYSFNELIGVRVGRNKLPLGLYGEVLDVDMLRPFAFLPLDVYQKSFRPLGSAYDGAGLFGVIPLKAAGSLDYQLNYGWVVGIKGDEPFFRYNDSNTPQTTKTAEAGKVASGALYWNVPVDGLRAGVSFFKAHEVQLDGPMRSWAEVAQLNGDARGLAYLFPQPVWDAIMRGQNATLLVDYSKHAASLEYTHNDWQFAAEYFWSNVDGANVYPQPLGTIPLNERLEAYYGMATYQVTKKVQLGAYYAESFANKHDRSGDSIQLVPKHTGYIKDLAVAASFAVNDWWLVKLEVHDLRGTKGVGNDANGDAAQWKRNWNYIVLKSTVSF